MNKIRILVVDDHTIMREGIRALLISQNDMEIVGEASEGYEAIKKVKELTPDVIIMDIAMPEMDGLEATRRIKRINPKAKVLILTQHDNREYILSAIKTGVMGYVPKRALASELVSAIRIVYKGSSYLHPSATTTLIEDYVHQVEAEPFDSLTNRERETLKLIAEGYSSREIADMLCLSLKTVHNHRNKIMQKLDLHNRTQLIKYAISKGLINTGM